jgi:hypothetical protein
MAHFATTRSTKKSAMVKHLEGSARLRVLIAGGDLLAPEEEFPYHPLAVTEAFGLGGMPRLPLFELAESASARLSRGALSSVDADRRLARTRAGEELSYDVRVVAPFLAARGAGTIPEAPPSGPGVEVEVDLGDMAAGTI